MPFHQQLRDKQCKREDAARVVAAMQSAGKTVVFTNGCFDILHPGHVDYLCKARDLGDVLVLGLNTDASVRRLGKAPDRPINDEHSRALVLAGLACIDLIVLFDEDTPYDLIHLLKPNVLVKGDDYELTKIVGYDIVTGIGGRVVTIPFLQGYSTTGIIQKIISGR